TQDAEDLSRLCTHFFNELEECVFELTHKASEVEIVIGASHSFMANWLIPRLEKLESLYPNISIKLMTCNDLKLLEKEKIDIFIDSLNVVEMLSKLFDKFPLVPDNIRPVCNGRRDALASIDDLFEHPLLQTSSKKNA